MITLTYAPTSTAITLPCGLVWLDRHKWLPVIDVTERTVTGALVVEPWARTGGKPVTLQSGEDYALFSRATIKSLETIAAIPGATMALNFHGTALSVMWRHEDGPAIDGEDFWAAGAHADTDYVRATLKFRTV